MLQANHYLIMAEGSWGITYRKYRHVARPRLSTRSAAFSMSTSLLLCGLISWSVLKMMQQWYFGVYQKAAVMLIKELWGTRFTGADVEVHCTEWRERIRRLKVRDIALAPEMECYMFLETLPLKYKPFTDFTLLKGDMAPEKVYASAVEYGQANTIDGDEAATDSVALEAKESQPEGGGTYHRGPQCYNCRGHGHIQFDCDAPCGFCKSRDHVKFDCPRRRNRDPSRKRGRAEKDGKDRVEEVANLARQLKRQKKKTRKMAQTAAKAGFDINYRESDSDSE
jgi:hypothetical protein